MAHELGHNWGRHHAPGCGAPQPDTGFPYANGSIGTWGYDLANGLHLSPASYNDLMGYCQTSNWISDYTYRGVMNYRQQYGYSVVTSGAAVETRLLLVTGWVDGDRLELDPLTVMTGVANPVDAGPYTFLAWDTAGAEVVRVAFDTIPVSLDDLEGLHLTIPLPEGVTGLSRVRIEREGRVLLERLPTLRRSSAIPTTATRRSDGSVRVTWDAGAYAAVLVRDGVDGALLGQDRQGSLAVWPSGSVLELLLSDGLNTTRQVIEF